MITARKCADYAGLAPGEIVLGTVPAFKQSSLLSGYLLNIARGPQAVREMIVSDLRDHLESGDRQSAADLLIVLSSFFAKYPEARIGAASGVRNAAFDEAPEI